MTIRWSFHFFPPLYQDLDERGDSTDFIVMTREKTLRICNKRHSYYKTSSCPVCPICEKEKQSIHGFLTTLSAPARRALEREGITDLGALSTYSESEILALHGMGPSSIPKLKQALEEAGLSFSC